MDNRDDRLEGAQDEQVTTKVGTTGHDATSAGPTVVSTPRERAPFQGDYDAFEGPAIDRRLRNSRIVIGVLIAVVILLALTLIGFVSGAFGARDDAKQPAIEQQDPAQDAGEDDPAGDGVLGGVLGGTGDESQNGSDVEKDDAASDDVTDDGRDSEGSLDSGAQGTPAFTAADLTEIVGEKWSNAQRILDAYGVDMDSLVLITDDGGQVINPSNWTVTLVADLADSGKVAVHLRHDTDNWWDTLGDSVQEVLP